MGLTPGARLGPYEIQSPLGSGGMGEVYKARDTRLDRTVAIKVLPAHVASDRDRRERFDREARAVAALNHPHICTLHDVGQQDGIDFLVMEYLEGQTLAERLEKGALPLDQALQYAIQIADALDKAHRHGIVHRDLKPGNIMLTKAGAKLLDFGLAKSAAPLAAGAGLSALPTTPPNLTAHGTILGTFQYMAPEQLEGKDADARSDIFAFGAIIYEMATGKRAFEGQSAASVIAAILEREPPAMMTLQPMTPPPLDHIVRICLAKDSEARFQSAHDVFLDLRWVAEASSQAGIPAPGGVRRRMRLQFVTAGVMLSIATIASLATWWLAGPPPAPPPSVVRTTIALPADAEFIRTGRFTGANVAISPDGTRVVYVGVAGDQSQLYLRSLDQLEITPIAGTGDAQSPFFSPDAQWVAFFAEGKLKKVPIGGGASLTLCDAAFGFGGAWSDDGTIVFAGQLLGGLSRVSATGGTPQPFTTLAKGEGSHRWPALVSASRDVLFAVESSFSWNDARIAIQSLDATEHHIVLDGGTSPRYVPTGHIVFARAGSLLAAPFDAARRATTGPQLSVLKDVTMTALGGDAHYALSRSGTLVYSPGGEEDVRRSLVWVDRKGNAQALPIEARGFETPRLSPDGKRVALTVREGDSDIWVLELGRSTLTRTTYEAGEDHSAVWTPDGRRVTYSSTRGSQSRVALKNADGSGDEEQLFVADQHQHLGGWTPDGRTLITDGGTPTGSDLYTATVGDKGPPRVYLRTPFIEQNPQVSPDGHWIAYRSDESGRPEVYVQAFPGPGGRWQISTDGGTEPVWARSGRELFYHNGDEMMTVAIETESAFRAGSPRILFKGQYAHVVWRDANYDVSPDGQQFLMIKEIEPARSTTQINVVLNWLEELKRRVPSGKK